MTAATLRAPRKAYGKFAVFTIGMTAGSFATIVALGIAAPCTRFLTSGGY